MVKTGTGETPAAASTPGTASTPGEASRSTGRKSVVLVTTAKKGRGKGEDEDVFDEAANYEDMEDEEDYEEEGSEEDGSEDEEGEGKSGGRSRPGGSRSRNRSGRSGAGGNDAARAAAAALRNRGGRGGARGRGRGRGRGRSIARADPSLLQSALEAAGELPDAMHRRRLLPPSVSTSAWRVYAGQLEMEESTSDESSSDEDEGKKAAPLWAATAGAEAELEWAATGSGGGAAGGAGAAALASHPPPWLRLPGARDAVLIPLQALPSLHFGVTADPDPALSAAVHAACAAVLRLAGLRVLLGDPGQLPVGRSACGGLASLAGTPRSDGQPSPRVIEDELGGHALGLAVDDDEDDDNAGFPAPATSAGAGVVSVSSTSSAVSGRRGRGGRASSSTCGSPGGRAGARPSDELGGLDLAHCRAAALSAHRAAIVKTLAAMRPAYAAAAKEAAGVKRVVARLEAAAAAVASGVVSGSGGEGAAAAPVPPTTAEAAAQVSDAGLARLEGLIHAVIVAVTTVAQSVLLQSFVYGSGEGLPPCAVCADWESSSGAADCFGLDRASSSSSLASSVPPTPSARAAASAPLLAAPAGSFVAPSQVEALPPAVLGAVGVAVLDSVLLLLRSAAVDDVPGAADTLFQRCAAGPAGDATAPPGACSCLHCEASAPPLQGRPALAAAYASLLTHLTSAQPPAPSSPAIVRLGHVLGHRLARGRSVAAAGALGASFTRPSARPKLTRAAALRDGGLLSLSGIPTPEVIMHAGDAVVLNRLATAGVAGSSVSGKPGLAPDAALSGAELRRRVYLATGGVASLFDAVLPSTGSFGATGEDGSSGSTGAGDAHGGAAGSGASGASGSASAAGLGSAIRSSRSSGNLASTPGLGRGASTTSLAGLSRAESARSGGTASTGGAPDAPAAAPPGLVVPSSAVSIVSACAYDPVALRKMADSEGAFSTGGPVQVTRPRPAAVVSLAAVDASAMPYTLPTLPGLANAGASEPLGLREALGRAHLTRTPDCRFVGPSFNALMSTAFNAGGRGPSLGVAATPLAAVLAANASAGSVGGSAAGAGAMTPAELREAVETAAEAVTGNAKKRRKRGTSSHAWAEASPSDEDGAGVQPATLPGAEEGGQEKVAKGGRGGARGGGRASGGGLAGALPAPLLLPVPAASSDSVTGLLLPSMQPLSSSAGGAGSAGVAGSGASGAGASASAGGVSQLGPGGATAPLSDALLAPLVVAASTAVNSAATLQYAVNAYGRRGIEEVTAGMRCAAAEVFLLPLRAAAKAVAADPLTAAAGSTKGAAPASTTALPIAQVPADAGAAAPVPLHVRAAVRRLLAAGEGADVARPAYAEGSVAQALRGMPKRVTEEILVQAAADAWLDAVVAADAAGGSGGGPASASAPAPATPANATRFPTAPPGAATNAIAPAAADADVLRVLETVLRVPGADPQLGDEEVRIWVRGVTARLTPSQRAFLLRGALAAARELGVAAAYAAQQEVAAGSGVPVLTKDGGVLGRLTPGLYPPSLGLPAGVVPHGVVPVSAVVVAAAAAPSSAVTNAEAPATAPAAVEVTA